MEYDCQITAINVYFIDRMPEFQIRLVPPVVGVQYMGRLEVNINSTWGTVSATSSSFGKSAGDIVCNQLNYSRACSNVYRGRIGQGRGKLNVLSYQLTLISHEIF